MTLTYDYSAVQSGGSIYGKCWLILCRKASGRSNSLPAQTGWRRRRKRCILSWDVRGKHFVATDFMETVGIQPDGTLWISENPAQNKWTAGTLQRYGSETNWRQLAQGNTSVVLLKNDGTLWRWGSVTNELHHWPGLRTFTPYQIGTNSDWQELFALGGIFARQTDGRVWRLNVDWKTGQDELERTTNLTRSFCKQHRVPTRMMQRSFARTEPCGCSTAIGTRKAG